MNRVCHKGLMLVYVLESRARGVGGLLRGDNEKLRHTAHTEQVSHRQAVRRWGANTSNLRHNLESVAVNVYWVRRT